MMSMKVNTLYLRYKLLALCDLASRMVRATTLRFFIVKGL